MSHLHTTVLWNRVIILGCIVPIFTAILANFHRASSSKRKQVGEK